MHRTKRIFDVLAGCFGLVALAPAMGAIALVILFCEGSPVLFRQERVGLHGRCFVILKFRTMVRDADQLGRGLTVGADSRITRVGYWLRRSKLDELPQLINVIKGEMSLVGPRPEIPEYVAIYTNWQQQVLELVPGITDPASVAFHDEASVLQGFDDPERAYIEQVMPKKIRLNLAYAEKAGVFSDIKVIIKTLRVLWYRVS